jgi:hypothetical protein
MPTINYYIQTDKNPAGIYVRLREGSLIDCKARTKYSVNPDHWDSGMRKSKGKLGKIKEQGLTAAFLKDAAGKTLKNNLETFKSKLLDHYNKCIDKEKINSQWLKYYIDPPTSTEGIPDALVNYFDHYIKHKESELKPASIKKLKGVKRLVEKFEKETGKQYLIKEVGDEFKLRFEKYCLKNNYTNNTIARYIKFIKTICYNGRDKGIETHFSLNSIKVKIQPVNKIHLSFDELKKIEEVKLDQDHLDNARDWLLISCHTGQRVSDFLRFKKEMIKKTGKSNILEFTQVKTGKNMGIPLNSKVMTILKKRKGDFPVQTTDQTYNENIKKVCKAAGLTEKIKGAKYNHETGLREVGSFEKWELVSSHIGRRSLASNYHRLVPTPILMYMTGHKTEDMFNAYIGKSQSESAVQAAKYFK